MTPDQEKAFQLLADAMESLTGMVQAQAKMIDELLKQNQQLLAQVQALEAIGRAKL